MELQTPTLQSGTVSVRYDPLVPRETSSLVRRGREWSVDETSKGWQDTRRAMVDYLKKRGNSRTRSETTNVWFRYSPGPVFTLLTLYPYE